LRRRAARACLKRSAKRAALFAGFPPAREWRSGGGAGMAGWGTATSPVAPCPRRPRRPHRPQSPRRPKSPRRPQSPRPLSRESSIRVFEGGASRVRAHCGHGRTAPVLKGARSARLYSLDSRLRGNGGEGFIRWIPAYAGMARWGTATAPAAPCPRRPHRPQSPCPLSREWRGGCGVADCWRSAFSPNPPVRFLRTGRAHAPPYQRSNRLPRH